MDKNLTKFKSIDITSIREDIINDETLSKDDKIIKLINLIDNVGNLEIDGLDVDEYRKSFFELSKELSIIIKSLASYNLKYNKYVDKLVLNYSNYKNKNTLDGYFSEYLQLQLNVDVDVDVEEIKNNNLDLNSEIKESKDELIDISFNEFMLLLMKELKTTNKNDKNEFNDKDTLDRDKRKREVSDKFLTFIYKKYPNLNKIKHIEKRTFNKEIKGKNDENQFKNEILLKSKNTSCSCNFFFIIFIIAFAILLYKYYSYSC